MGLASQSVFVYIALCDLVGPMSMHGRCMKLGEYSEMRVSAAATTLSSRPLSCIKHTLTMMT